MGCVLWPACTSRVARVPPAAQEPRSWQSHGALLSGANALPPSDSDVLALEPVETYASLVYVVVLHSGKVCVGERTFKLQTVRNLQQQVSASVRRGGHQR